MKECVVFATLRVKNAFEMYLDGDIDIETAFKNYISIEDLGDIFDCMISEDGGKYLREQICPEIDKNWRGYLEYISDRWVDINKIRWMIELKKKLKNGEIS